MAISFLDSTGGEATLYVRIVGRRCLLGFNPATGGDCSISLGPAGLSEAIEFLDEVEKRTDPGETRLVRLPFDSSDQEDDDDRPLPGVLILEARIDCTMIAVEFSTGVRVSVFPPLASTREIRGVLADAVEKISYA